MAKHAYGTNRKTMKQARKEAKQAAKTSLVAQGKENPGKKARKVVKKRK